MEIFKICRWFDYTFYQYLFERPFDLTKLWCRIGYHKCGPVYYNPNGLEPDGHCKNCGDEIM